MGKKRRRVLKIAHRGASKYSPENSKESFKKAIKLGADIIEFDIHLTKDKKAVVIHNPYLKKTTNGTGWVKNLTLKKIKKFHNKNGEPIATLQEALNILKNKCTCKIDMKDKGMEKLVLKTIKSNNLENNVIITSKHLKSIKKLKKINPKIKVEAGGFKTKMPTDYVIKKAKEINANIIGPHHSIINKKLVDEAHKNNLEIHAWTANTKKTIKKMKNIGVDGITSDYPDKI